MKTGEIRKVVWQDYKGEKYYATGIIYDITKYYLRIFQTNGKHNDIRLESIIKEASTRLPEETRKLLKDWYKLYEKMKKLLQEKKELDFQMSKIGEKELANSMGFFSKSEFKDEFVKNLPVDRELLGNKLPKNR